MIIADDNRKRGASDDGLPSAYPHRAPAGKWSPVEVCDTSPCVVTMEALSGLATSHTGNISRDMLPDPLDRDNTRLPLNSLHSSTFWLSKYGSPSHVLKKTSDTYHTEKPSYFRDKHV